MNLEIDLDKIKTIAITDKDGMTIHIEVVDPTTLRVSGAADGVEIFNDAVISMTDSFQMYRKDKCH